MQLSDRVLNSFQTASITFNYLKTKSSSHHSPFSALAELTDNSKDAHANNVMIDFVRRGDKEFLEILDDGDGMSQEEVQNTFAFGHSDKLASDITIIGRYGNGLKSGGLRIGSELLLLTKKNGLFTAMMISNIFHEALELSAKVFVPCPCFDLNFRPVARDLELHAAEVDVINNYGPLGGETLRSLFNKIRGQSGTLIVIGGLKRGLLGSLEINVSNSENDITLEGEDREEWESSLRKYLSILYMDSRMKIYLRGTEVIPKQLSEWFMIKRNITIHNINLIGNWERNLRQLERDVAQLKDRESEYGSKVGDMNNMEMGIDRESRRIRNEALKKYEDARAELQRKKKEKEDHEKNKKNGVSVHFNCGLNCKDRHNYGIYFYLNQRLIIAGYKNIAFYKNNKNIGMSMIISLTYDVVSPTHDKQGIENQTDFAMLIKTCSLVLQKYLEFLEKDAIPKLLSEKFCIRMEEPFVSAEVWKTFWTALGYSSPFSITCRQQTLTLKQERAIHAECGYWRKCKKCQFWRHTRGIVEPPEPFGCSGRCKLAADDAHFIALNLPKTDPKPHQALHLSKRMPVTVKNELTEAFEPQRNSVKEEVLIEEYESEIDRFASNMGRRPQRSAAITSANTSLNSASSSAPKRSADRRGVVVLESSDDEAPKKRKTNARTSNPTRERTSGARASAVQEDPLSDESDCMPERMRAARHKSFTEDAVRVLNFLMKKPHPDFVVSEHLTSPYSRMRDIRNQIEAIEKRKK